jgi:hypothetical protein
MLLLYLKEWQLRLGKVQQQRLQVQTPLPPVDDSCMVL